MLVVTLLPPPLTTANNIKIILELSLCSLYYPLLPHHITRYYSTLFCTTYYYYMYYYYVYTTTTNYLHCRMCRQIPPSPGGGGGCGEGGEKLDLLCSICLSVYPSGCSSVSIACHTFEPRRSTLFNQALNFFSSSERCSTDHIH